MRVSETREDRVFPAEADSDAGVGPDDRFQDSASRGCRSKDLLRSVLSKPARWSGFLLRKTYPVSFASAFSDKETGHPQGCLEQTPQTENRVPGLAVRSAQLPVL